MDTETRAPMSGKERAAYTREQSRLVDFRKELRETLRDLEEWDGTPDALECIKDNLRAALRRPA